MLARAGSLRVTSLAFVVVAACATYEPPARLGAGGDAGAAGDQGGKSAGGSGAMGGNSAATGGAGGSTGGKGEPQGGSAPNAGSAGIDVGGGAGSGSGESGAGGEGGDVGGADECPADPAKTTPGACGCGLPDTDTATLAGCASLKAALIHRYDFEGAGVQVVDRVGTAHGTIVGDVSLSQVAGKGVVVLTGGTSGPYVDLPNKLISVLANATLEMWITWDGGSAWQRLFDFGDSMASTPEDNPTTGKSYLFVTPQIGGGTMRAVYSLAGGSVDAETRLVASLALPQALAHVALVVDAAGDELVLYVDGESAGSEAFTGTLSSINDVNVWLGRSQYDADPELTGTIHEFRVYSAALTAKQIATSFAGGPDPAFLAK